MARISRIRRVVLATAVFLGFGTGVYAAGALPVVLEPITHSPANLTIVDDAGVEHVYSPADIEEWPTFRLTTTTPWRNTPADFDGALLLDLLSAHGLDDNAVIVVTAENDFKVTIPVAALADVPILVATRVGGLPHSRRARGPIQFVVSDAEAAAHPDSIHESYMVWMAARIEPMTE